MNEVLPRPSSRGAGTRGTCGDAGLRRERQSRLVKAWERFAAGDDAVPGVRPHILLSWYRCRDVYDIDPLLASAPEAGTEVEHSLHQDMIFTELGGAAGAAAARELSTEHILITVTDPAGRILASWGSSAELRRGAAGTLAPRFAWSERASGTNGMGTALVRPGIALVQGAEHWCRGFHRWSSAGLAVRDPVTQRPLAALNLSRWDDDVPAAAVHWLRRAATDLQAELRHRAVRSAERLVEALADAESEAGHVLLALDLAGKVVAANEAARLVLGIVCPQPAVDPNARLTPDVPGLGRLVEQAVRRAGQAVDWCGSAELPAPFPGDPVTAEVRPVRAGHDVVGVLVVGCEHPHGERIEADGAPDEPGTPRFPPRVAAVRGSRIVLLSPHEIKYAEADHHTVWLATDRGRMPAVTRGLDNVERQLGRTTFLRVHRRYLVNVGRITELEHGFKGAMTLTTSSREHEAIPVSRSRSAQLRRALGI
jgi:hypothetical protein